MTLSKLFNTNRLDEDGIWHVSLYERGVIVCGLGRTKEEANRNAREEMAVIRSQHWRFFPADSENRNEIPKPN